MAGKKTIIFLGLLALFIADRLVKNLIILKLPETGVLLFEGVELKPLINANLALSLPVNNWLAVGLGFTALLAAVIFLHPHLNNRPLGFWGLGLLTIGAVSNLIDRLKLDGVLDFIQPNFWPTAFNLSDVYIILGCLLLLAVFSPVKQGLAGRK